MLVKRFCRTLFGAWIHPLSLRFGYVLMFGGSTWIMCHWTSRWFGEYAGGIKEQGNQAPKHSPERQRPMRSHPFGGPAGLGCLLSCNSCHGL